MSLARFAFQACAIDHSAISPFRINNLQSDLIGLRRDCDTSSNPPRSLTGASSIAAADKRCYLHTVVFLRIGRPGGFGTNRISMTSGIMNVICRLISRPSSAERGYCGQIVASSAAIPTSCLKTM